MEQAHGNIDWKGWSEQGFPLPGEDAHRALMPFGRTSAQEARAAGQAGVDYREAGVFIGLESAGRFALIQRAPGGGVHGGQMAIPGGRREPGESLEDCALREWREELGLPDACIPLRPPVALTEVHVAPSGYIVRPFVAPVHLPATLKPDPTEVAAVHFISLDALMDPSSRSIARVRAGAGQGFTIEAPGFAFDGVPFIWGATSMILSELAEWARQWSGTAG